MTTSDAADRPDDSSIFDVGAQAERTRLAWNRTALATAVTAALLTHVGEPSIVHHVATFAMLLAAVGCFVFADFRYRQINATVRVGRAVAVTAHPAVLALLALLPAVIALISVVVP